MISQCIWVFNEILATYTTALANWCQQWQRTEKKNLIHSDDQYMVNYFPWYVNTVWSFHNYKIIHKWRKRCFILYEPRNVFRHLKGHIKNNLLIYLKWGARRVWKRYFLPTVHSPNSFNGQAKSKSQEIHQGLPCGYRQQDHKWRTWNTNWYPQGRPVL